MTDEEYAIRHDRAIKAMAWLYDNYLKKLAAKAREAEDEKEKIGGGGLNEPNAYACYKARSFQPDR